MVMALIAKNKIRFIDDNYTCPPIVDISIGPRRNAIVW